MHISEGVLSLQVLSAGGILTAAGLAIGMRKVAPRDIPKIALLTAAFFVASLVHVPIGPSNAHLVLNGLLGVLLGWAAFPAIFIGLVLQAVLFQFGGLTTLGVNTANMAIPGVIFGLIARRFLSIERPYFSAVVSGLCGGLSVLCSALLVALSLALSGDSFTLVAKLIFTAHLPIAAVEALITGFIIRFLLRVRPEMIGCHTGSPDYLKTSTRALFFACALLAFLVPRTAQAHRVSVFAWFDGKTITGKAYYSNGRPASMATLLIKRDGKAQCYRLKTNMQGDFTFRPPGPGRYLLELHAGEGHRANTTVSVAPLARSSSPSTSLGLQHGEQGRAKPAPGEQPEGPGKSALGCCGCGDIRQIINFALEKRLVPISKELETLAIAETRVTLKDVIAGFGYIMGIMGIWAYISSRKRGDS